MSITFGKDDRIGEDMTMRRQRSAAEAITYIFWVNILINETMKNLANGAKEFRKVLNKQTNHRRKKGTIV
jgi:hypothetical protein